MGLLGLAYDSEPYLTIKTTDGRVIEGHVDYASGAPQNPLPPEKIVGKFEILAERVLPMARVAEIRGHVYPHWEKLIKNISN
jgi:hypothetical protein